jgi:hypothetical protein
VSLQPTVVMLDPARRDDQIAALTERVPDLRDFGDRVWMRIDDDQAERFAAQGFLVQRYPDAELVVLPAVAFRPPGETAQPPAALAAAPPSGTDTAYAVVLFAGPPQPEWIDAARELGAVFVDDLSGQASIARLSASAADAVGALAFVAWWGWYHPAYAIAFALCGRTAPYGASDFGALAVDPAQVDGKQLGVSFFDDAVAAELRGAVEAAGARVVDEASDQLVVEVAAAQVADLARVPGVRALEPSSPGGLANMRAGVITGVNQVRDRGPVSATLPVELDGAGEIVHVLDSGLHGGTIGALHPDYTARVILLYNSWDPAPPAPPGPVPAPVISCKDFATHGSHVVGTIAGDGTQAAGFAPAAGTPASLPRGVAPAAQIVFHSVNRASPPHPAPGAAGAPPYVTESPVDFRNYLRAFRTAHAWGARVHSNSWEYRGGTNVYDGTSTIFDTFAFLNPEDVVVAASGNDEADYNNDGVLDANKLGNIAVAKNVLAVGASENVTKLEGIAVPYGTAFSGPPARFANGAFNVIAGPAPVAGDYPFSDNPNQIALFSNRGRVAGAVAPAVGRVRPDIVAPGTNILSTAPPWPWPNHTLAPGGANPPAVPNVPRADLAAASAPPHDYYVLTGTSMATPHVAGACLLARQFYRVCYGQLRRPVHLSNETVLVDRPAVAAHRDGCVVAWTHGGAQDDIHAIRLNAATLAAAGTEVTLQTNVGGAPAICVARSGENTVLLHRGADNALRLSLYDPQLAPVAAFGTSGVVTLAPLSRNEPERHPALCVRDAEIAVVWVETATDNLRFQRFAATDGHAIDAAPLTLGPATSTSAAPFVLHDGTRYAVAWARLDGANHTVLMRFVENAGTVAGAAPLLVFTQPQPIAAPHLAYDPRLARYLVAWVSDQRAASGDIVTRLVDTAGVPVPALPATSVVRAPAGKTVRAPQLALHPSAGFTLTWEDDSRGTFDAFFALLGNDGHADGRVPHDRLLLSDVPAGTHGASTLVTPDGIVVTWHGDETANVPLFAVDALALTTAGAFRSVRDPHAPLLDSGRWVTGVLLDQAANDQTAVAAAWGGGGWFLMRAFKTAPHRARIELVPVNADGMPDPAYGAAGARAVDSANGFATAEAYFTGTELIALAMRDWSAKVFLFDAAGNAVAGFGGAAGSVDLRHSLNSAIRPALAHRGTGPTFQIVVAYAQADPGGAIPTWRLLDRTGAIVKTIHDNANRASGTARHGWFHFVPTDSVPRFIAVWHRITGANGRLHLQRFVLDAAQTTPQSILVGTLNEPAGDARNAVLAPRPVAFDPNAIPPIPGGFNANAANRFYGLAFQARAAAAGAYQITFSHLTRNGDADPAVAQNVVVAANAASHQTDPQLVWHTDGYGLAWREQPTAGGAHRLMFACIDPAGVPLAPPYAVSSATADVAAFALAWNGKRFHLTWTETEAGRLRQVQSAVTALHDRNATGYDRPFAHPSSALVRATLINGATNITGTALPNFSNAINDGYGWGRLNLRQTFAPAPPVTYFARDDGAVVSLGTARYVFTLPPDTRILRVTLNWTDPPGIAVMNNLDLRITTPAWGAGPRVYVGNRWGAVVTRYSDPLPSPPPANPFDGTHTVEQIVLRGDPTLPSGDYVVEVIGGAFTGTALQQFPSQPFALVFVGSGEEWNLAPPTSAGVVGFY